jgi:hypothetical protein
MRVSLTLLTAGVLALGPALACRPTPKPPASSDTTVAVPDSAVPDSVAPDSVRLDPSDTVADSTGEVMPDATPADTVVPAATLHAAEARPHGSTGVRSADTLLLAPVGMPMGLSAMSDKALVAGGLTGTYQGVQPRIMAATLRASARLGNARVIALPRVLQTANGQLNGEYCVRCTWRAIDQMVALIPPDTVARYVQLGTWRGENLMDDVGCGDCWGHADRPITKEQVDSVYRYAKAKLWPSLPDSLKPPLFIRVHPLWFNNAKWAAANIDGFWVQYVLTRGDIQTWFDKNAAFARTLGHPVRVIYGLNYYHYDPRALRPITASELARAGAFTIQYDGNCFLSGFKYWDRYRENGRGAVFDSLAALARATPAASCHPG